MPRASLSFRDLSVLRMLARVRLLSVRQVAALIANDGPEAAARSLLRRLECAGLVSTYRIVAREPIDSKPIATFHLGGATPDFLDVSRQLRARANLGESVLVEVVRLADEGARTLGVPTPRLARASEGSHELRLAEVAVEIEKAAAVAHWLSEDQLMRGRLWHGVFPDAEVFLKSGHAFALECGGTYSRGKLARFHARVVPQLEARGLHGYRIV